MTAGLTICFDSERIVAYTARQPMLAFGVVLTIVIVVALGASYLITRAARLSPLANILIGAFAVVIGFVLLVLVILILQHSSTHSPGVL